MTTPDFAFVSGGKALSGVIDQPASGVAWALFVFVHGYGPPTCAAGYADLRGRFARLGIAGATWDKPGQGRSEGEFEINQLVDDSAREVLDAVAHLRAQGLPGSDRIGMWGISRAGWIVPIALSRDPDIDFWISVSGVTAEDNFVYLLSSNWPLDAAPARQRGSRTNGSVGSRSFEPRVTSPSDEPSPGPLGGAAQATLRGSRGTPRSSSASG